MAELGAALAATFADPTFTGAERDARTSFMLERPRCLGADAGPAPRREQHGRGGDVHQGQGASSCYVFRQLARRGRPMDVAEPNADTRHPRRRNPGSDPLQLRSRSRRRRSAILRASGRAGRRRPIFRLGSARSATSAATRLAPRPSRRPRAHLRTPRARPRSAKTARALSAAMAGADLLTAPTSSKTAASASEMPRSSDIADVKAASAQQRRPSRRRPGRRGRHAAARASGELR